MGRGKKIWPKTVELWWCPECNVPLVYENCSKCGSSGFKIKLAEPGDARPAFAHDIEKLRECMEIAFKTSKPFNKLVRGKFILVNKASYLDDMKEIYVDGIRIGHLYYDPKLLMWRFKLDRGGAEILVEEGLVETLDVERVGRVRRINVNAKFEEGTQVVLCKNGEAVGVGEYLEGGLEVLKWFKSKSAKPETSGRGGGLKDAIEANEYAMYVEESRAKKFLHVMNEKVSKPLIASYSGGKDSLSCLHLTLDLGLEPVLLFNNTGMELPETIASVEKVQDTFGLELVVADAGEAFWEAVEKLGPPARDYRWCCKVTKLVPLAKTIKERWVGGGLNVVGQRAYESIDRAKSPRVWRNKYVPSLLSISPIQDWSQYQVWLYIYREKIEELVNPLYFKGFDRIGCYMCPACRLSEFDVVSKVHKELWLRWVEVLEKWREKLRLPREWVTYGLWRWLTPSSSKTNLARKIGVEVGDWRETYKHWISPTILEFKVGDYGCKLLLSEKINLDIIENQHPIIGRNPRREGETLEIESRDRRLNYKISVWGEIRVEGGECIEPLIDLLKTYFRGLYCVKCLSCKIWCPNTAIESGGPSRVIVDGERCSGCKICLEVCPLSDVVVEKIVTPQLLGDPRAWKRKGKRRREDVVKVLATRHYPPTTSECQVKS